MEIWRESGEYKVGKFGRMDDGERRLLACCVEVTEAGDVSVLFPEKEKKEV